MYILLATLSFLNGERSHTAVNRKPPTGRGNKYFYAFFNQNRATQMRSYLLFVVKHPNPLTNIYHAYV